MLEGLVWGVVVELVQEHRSRLSAQPIPDVDQERQRLQRELKRLEAAEDRFLDLYGDARIGREKLDQKLEEVHRKRQQATEQLQALERRGQEQAQQLRRLDSLQGFCETIRVGLEELTDEERQQVLRLLVERVTIREKSIRIELAVPLGDPQAVYRLRTTRAPSSPPDTIAA